MTDHKTTGQSIGFQSNRPNALIFTLDAKEVFRICADGSVKVADGFSVDDAARTFWDAVQRFAPTSRQVKT